jgi:succinyl-CoA synthetase beta subunit
MKIHEYQAKQILARYGVPTTQGDVAESPAAARQVAARIGKPVAVKAQVHVGGRGKAGGIKLAQTPEEAERVAGQILGMQIKGLTVEKVLVEEAVEIRAEYYLGITLDRSARRNVVMVSAVGGVDIEEVAASTPEKIARALVHPGLGLAEFQITELLFGAGLDATAHASARTFLRALYRAYVELDCSIAEINPLALLSDGRLIAADAKINIDDNALFRHPEFESLKEEAEEDPIEAEAHRRGLQYVRLGGSIGIIGNGAGLVMGTLDEVKRAGGTPANFLDIGGGAQADLVRNAIDVVVSDPNVRGVFFNVFGGITRGDEVARGIVEGVQKLNLKVPLVVRLTGTNEAEGIAILEQNGIAAMTSMEEAARKVVELVAQ